MHPKEISIQDYTYELPEERIAKFPLARRDESKLLIYRQGQISQDLYQNIADYLPQNSLLLFNDTRVVEARILFQKPSGGVVEIFCLEPMDPMQDLAMAMQQKANVFWKCLIGGASKWKQGIILEKMIREDEREIHVKAKFFEKKADHFIIQLSWHPENMPFAELLHHIGAIPLPPYIKRKAEDEDKVRYQTIYASQDGSVAAPTAGLHFTDAIFERFTEKKIRKEWVTLHVGAGTFMPVKTRKLEGHLMHAECIHIGSKTIQSVLDSLEFPIFPVGTTSLRTLESLYWMGIRALLNPDIEPGKIGIHQWEAYALTDREIPVRDALLCLQHWMEKHFLKELITTTRLLIAPGYSFRIASGIITNFHQPQSTLLLLVSAMIGDDWKKVYEYALNNEFRFLSYGDGSLIFR